MMGETISDPKGIEGDLPLISGLGLLPINTLIENEKVTEQCQFKFKDYADVCSGYEIHMGQTSLKHPENYLNKLSQGKEDGYYLNEKCWGSYIHGILDNSVVIQDLLEGFNTEDINFDYNQFKEEQYNKLADAIRENVNMDLVYQHLSE